LDKKGPFTVKELKHLPAGKQVWGKYLIIEKRERKTRDDRIIIDLKLGDSSGEIDAIVWDNCSVTGEMKAACVIGLLGEIRTYNKRLQLNAKRIKILEEDPSEYLKTPDIDIHTLIDKFDTLLDAIVNTHLKEVLHRIFSSEIREKFFKSPAAKSIHHNYIGGLLEHTLSVAELCSRAADSYPFLNKDLLLAGAILHDLGKIMEIELEVVPSYSVEGRLMGHIVLGSELLSTYIKQMRKDNIAFPEKLEWMLKHMILSHHGNLEYGSPVIPLFPEAFVLYMMDNLDAKLFVYKNKIEEDDSDDEFFSAYDKFFGQYFFKYRYQE
jgi:3'-5' exoribonuclease